MKIYTNLYIIISCLMLCFFGCTAAMKGITQFGAPAVKIAEGTVKAARPISDSEEYFLGRTVAAQIINMYPLSTNQKLIQYVNLIGHTIAMHSDKPETYGGYHFSILKTDELNAFACPGGIIFITTGLINLTKNEDELAAIIAHEIAHIYYRDGIATIKSSRWTQALTIIGSAAAQQYGSEGLAQLTDIFQGSVEDVLKTLVVSGYGQKQELRADKTAMRYLHQSGYNPVALLNVLNNFKAEGYATEKGFLKTHPGTDKRIKVTNKILSKKNYELELNFPNSRGMRYNQFVKK